MNEPRDSAQFERIAIVGMSGRFPGAARIAQFWENLCNGIEAVRPLPDEQLLSAGADPALLKNPSYVKAAVVLDGIEMFDAKFFGFAPKEAELMDPQHRLFLECAWEALEDAGYDPERNGSQVGVFAGAGLNYYINSIIASKPEALKSLGVLQRMLVTDKDYLATRVSYKLNLKGPSITIQSACSTSLVAVHLACQSLLNGECDMALAGGVSIRIPQIAGYVYEEGSIQSPDGHCRAFDADAQGMVIGSGAGIVVLKRLSDALSDGDSIRAVIGGSCINNDGADKVGYTAPSVGGQARVIAAAQALAGLSADEVTYVETHGTGTSLGDPIEVAALTQAFRKTTQRKSFCAIGSVKTNIGHLDAAAGVAGLMKVVCALQNRMLPPSLNFRKPNPAIDFATSPFYVQQSLSEWVGINGRRVAGVSSFGIGGTNAHLVVEEAPTAAKPGLSRPWQLLTISARTPAALENATDNLAEHLRRNPAAILADVAFTLQNGRRAFSHRRFLAARVPDEAAELLRSRNPARVHTWHQTHSERRVTFMFPGQAAQYANMGVDLYSTEQHFKTTVDYCCQFLKKHLGFDLLEVLYPSAEKTSEANERLEQTAITQPAVFVVEYALGKLLMEWGLHPEAMIGHSIGEYVAGCLAGVLPLEDALSLVAARGRLMQGMPKGAMMAVRLSEEEVQPLLGEELSLAAVNAPSSCVVAGSDASIGALQRRLSEKQIGCMLLQTSHAFHSSMMEPMIGPFRELFKAVKLNAPEIPYISNLTGTWIEPGQAIDPGYWASHLRNTVRFADGIAELLKSANRVLLEVGPGQALSSLAKQHSARGADHVMVSCLPGEADRPPESPGLVSALGQLWLAGAHIDWAAIHAGERRNRIPLPTYPFERQRYWINGLYPAAGMPPARSTGQDTPLTESVAPGAAQGSKQTEVNDLQRERLALSTAYVAPLDDVEEAIAAIWEEVIGIEKIGRDDDFFNLGGHSLLAAQLFAKIDAVLNRRIPLATIFQAPTIAKMASILREKEWTPSWASLVPIRPGGSKPPLFLCHGAEGNILLYRELANCLESDQPVYGLQSQGLDGSRSYLTNLEDMATRYISEMRSVQPQGPYYLGGYCMGGAIALEMAQQLHAQGQKVGLVALLETYNLDSNPRASTFLYKWYHRMQTVRFHLDNLLLLQPEGRSAFFHEKARVEKTRIRMKFSALAMRLTGSSTSAIQAMYPHIAITKANDRAVWQYVPRRYSGSIAVFRPRRFFAGLDDPHLGWKAVAANGVDTQVLPVYPRGMLIKPFVSLLAERLSACLERARRDSD